MHRPGPTLLGAVAFLATTGLLVSACSKSDTTAAAAGATTVDVTLTDSGCRPNPASIPAGPVTFKLHNENGSKVSEAELMRGDVIMGEKENLTPGLSGTFSLRLDAGTYSMYCPNATTEKWDFTVTGTASAAALRADIKASLDQAVDGYRKYVIGEVDKLIPATRTFTDAVRAGDLTAAKNAYAKARYFYEEVEPVAESFGDLDPDVDARADDVDDLATWTGFHRIEKALWADRSLKNMKPIADKLDVDVARLKTLVATTEYQPAQLANGATELLNEVASSKITGEEDRYGHTDLSDFEANVIGAKKAFELLVPALREIDPTLANTVTDRFADVLDSLRPYRQATGSYVNSGYVSYETVTIDQRKILTQKVDALAEPLSQVASKITGR